MKALFDYLPIIVFVAVFYLGGQDLILATWGIIIASTLQVTLGRLIFKRWDKLYVLIFCVTLVFGGLTVAFNNDTFIKWRHTISSLVIASILLGGHFLERNFIERLLNTFAERALGFPLRLARRDWQGINLACVIYFIVVALLNLYIAFNFSNAFWVNFSLYGFGAIQLVFFGLIFYFIYRRLPEEDRQKLHKSNEDN
jgi:intracellular septation protein